MNKEKASLESKIVKLNSISDYEFFSVFLNYATILIEEEYEKIGFSHKMISTNLKRMKLEELSIAQNHLILHALHRTISTIYDTEEDSSLVDLVKNFYLKMKEVQKIKRENHALQS